MQQNLGLTCTGDYQEEDMILLQRFEPFKKIIILGIACKIIYP